MSDNQENKGELLHCSFCGKSQDEVKKLIAGRGVYICDECIEVCINIVADEMEEQKAQETGSTGESLPSPSKIKEFHHLPLGEGGFIITLYNSRDDKTGTYLLLHMQKPPDFTSGGFVFL